MPSAAISYSRASTVLGWLIMLLYSAQTVLTVVMPRVEKTSLLREDLRSWHYLIGLTLFLLLLARLWRWWREPAPLPAAGMTATGHVFARGLALAAYLVLVLMPVLGITQAWSEGLTVRLGPFLTLPALLPENHLAWMFAGYFHSALGFSVMLLTVTTVVAGAWFWLRRGVGLVRAFAPGYGLQAWTAFGITLYAFSTFSAPDPGVPTVLTYLVISAVVAVVGLLLRARRPTAIPVSGVGPRPVPAALAGAVVVAIVALGAYGPYQMFRVTPWPMGEVVAAPPGVTSHAGPVMRVTVQPETAFEQQVKAETYKWCRFCHTVEAGAKHLAGPNLYAIFGQQAGTVPNFYFSPAMAEAGRQGLVWTDETLDRFLANPDKFLPGTTMIISSGPVKTPEERAAVINILKRETMPPESWLPVRSQAAD